MKLKQKFLYKKLSQSTLIKYSKFKFGELNAIDYFSEKLSKIILKDIRDGKKYVIYTTNKFPTKSYYKKNSLLLSEKISRKLKLPLIIGEYKYNYCKNDFYDNQIERKIHLPKIQKKDKLKYKNYIFLIIDDSVLTGTALKVSLDELDNVTNEVLFFGIINLSKGRYSEKEVNNIGFQIFGVKFLIDILKDKEYVFTTHMLRTIEGFTKQELSLLFKNLDEKKEKTLLKSFKKYIEKDLIL